MAFCEVVCYLPVVLCSKSCVGMQANADACAGPIMYANDAHKSVHIRTSYLARPRISRQALAVDVHCPLSDGLQPRPICTCRSQHLVSYHTHFIAFAGSSSAHVTTVCAGNKPVSLVQQVATYSRLTFSLEPVPQLKFPCHVQF